MDLSALVASDNGQLALGGAVGGLGKGLAFRERWRETLRHMVIGTICSVSFGKAGLTIFGPITEKLLPNEVLSLLAVGTIMGIGGMQIIYLVGDLWRIKRNSANSASSEPKP